MKLDLATQVGGPGILKLGPAAIYTKDGITLNPRVNTFPVPVDGHGDADTRVDHSFVEFGLTPAGVWGQYGRFYEVANWPMGSVIPPVIPFRDANLQNDTQLLLTGFPLYGLATGDTVYFGARGATPTGINPDTLYYVHAHADPGVFTLHLTLADAQTGANPVNHGNGAGGSGRYALVIERNLVLHTFAGKRITFFNGGVTAPGNIICGHNKTLFDKFTFSAWTRNRHDRIDANSLFKIEDAPFDDTSFDPAGIITQAYQVTWQNKGFPWDLMDTTDGITVNFNPSLDDRTTDNMGVTGKRLTNLEVTASLTPTVVDEEDLFARLFLQGTGAGVGRSLNAGGDDLDISGANVFIRLYGANLSEAPSNFNQKDIRAGALTFRASRTFNNGVANPLIYVGATAI
ncbi:MAG: hypothetical protein LBK76_04490 [Verrucomicrobiales bacterium]|jgi:hypothetical protein|nr:hypothetical protein [Verrucomicrobiales bacterium]